MTLWRRTRSGKIYSSQVSQVEAPHAQPEEVHSRVETNLSIREALLNAFAEADARDPERGLLSSETPCCEPLPSSSARSSSSSPSSTLSSPLSSVPGSPNLPPLDTDMFHLELALPMAPVLQLVNQPVVSLDNASEATRRQMVKKALKQRRVSKRRERERQAQATEHPSFGGKIKSSTSQKYRHPSNLKAGFNAVRFSAAKGLWKGVRAPVTEGLSHLHELIAQGLRVVQWDGLTPTVITDDESRIISVLAGRPQNDPSWDVAVKMAEEAMSMAHSQLRFGDSACLPRWSSRGLENRRGNFQTISVGVSYGGGQKKPGFLKHTEANAMVVHELLENRHIKRIATFGDRIFAFYAPRLYQRYATVMTTLYRRLPNLRPIFPNNVFPAASFNFGPQAVTAEHTDHNNLPNGWCLVFNGGSFDSKRGGHLILRELKLVVEFPPGSVVLVPSSAVRHGNVPIHRGETRMSFTLYAAGGLFRWVDYGCQTWSQLLEKDRKSALNFSLDGESRWQAAINLFSKVDELHVDHAQ